MRRFAFGALLVLLIPAAARAQAIPQPAQPVAFCVAQPPPAAVSYQLVFDAEAPVPLTMDATVNAACPAGTTHSFVVDAAKFTIGTHDLSLIATNEFGSTTGPVYRVTVGIAPGAPTITAVVPPGGGE